MRGSEKVDSLIALKNGQILLEQASHKQDRAFMIRPSQVSKLTAQCNPNSQVLMTFQVLFQNRKPSVVLGRSFAK